DLQSRGQPRPRSQQRACRRADRDRLVCAGLMPRSRIVCFGDLIDDVVVIPSGPVRDDTDTPSTIRFRPGGSAANTAAWLGALGASVDLVACVGRGDGLRHVEQLGGVRAALAEHPELPTGTIVILVDGERRHMLTERGANQALDPA